MKDIIKGLRTFKSRYFCSNQELFEELSHGQHPKVLFITCSDSRIDPNLLTQTQPGELFVIRNAGNIVPPYGATNGGEGASIEYAIHALGIEHLVICGHSHCGAIKGLLKLSSLEEEMPLVHNWLQHAEATRRLMKESYGDLEGEDLLDMAIAENVLTQIENLKTYPVIRAKLHQGKLKIYAWIYDIDTGEVVSYDAERRAYVPPHTQLHPSELDPELSAPVACEIPGLAPASAPANATITVSASTPVAQATPHGASSTPSNGDAQRHYAFSWSSPEQADRIYRGSANKR
ncbi:MAG TPA: carbonic anhydrase [Chroococcidiopsis sp.]